MSCEACSSLSGWIPAIRLSLVGVVVSDWLRWGQVTTCSASLVKEATASGVRSAYLSVGNNPPWGVLGVVSTTTGQKFQITGASVGGKVLTAKLLQPAISKIVTVNVSAAPGGKDHHHGIALEKHNLYFILNHLNWCSEIGDGTREFAFKQSLKGKQLSQ